MVVVAQQWILSLIKFKVLLAPWCYHEIYCPHCYHEVAPLQLLLIPLRNALVLVCFSAVLYCWIIPLTKENEHTFIYTLTMPCKTSLRTWLSSSSSTSDIIKLQMSLSLVALWVIPDISNLCKSVSDVNCLKWHSAFKTICWAGWVIMQSPPWFKGDTSFWLESDDCFQ